MIIEGPIRVSAESSEDGGGFSLRLSFADGFQALEEADPSRQGMLTVRQVGEQQLFEELEVGIGQQMPLASFLADSSGRLN